MTNKTRAARWITTLLAAALLLAPLFAEAAPRIGKAGLGRAGHAGRQVAQGRTRAIRAGIAAQLTKLNLSHVGKVRPSEIRLRSRPVKGIATHEAMGIHTRNVSWGLVRSPRAMGMLVTGMTRSFTPIPPFGARGGGAQTHVEALKLTRVPSGVPQQMIQAPPKKAR